MGTILSKCLSTPLNEDVKKGLCYRVGHAGMKGKDIRRLKSYVQRVTSDSRIVKQGSVDVEDLSAESRGFIDTLTKVRKHQNEA